MRIIIMRHGQPALDLEPLKKIKLSPKDLGEILEKYDLTDLNSDENPTQNALAIAHNCDVVLSSNMPRAITSVEMLGVKEKSIIDPEIRESSMPHTRWERPNLSFFTWCLLFRIAWFVGFKTNGESLKEAKRRAQKCASNLIDLAHMNKSVLLVGHGIMNRLIIKSLERNRWIKSESNGEHYWSYTVLCNQKDNSGPIDFT